MCVGYICQLFGLRGRETSDHCQNIQSTNSDNVVTRDVVGGDPVTEHLDLGSFQATEDVGEVDYEATEVTAPSEKGTDDEDEYVDRVFVIKATLPGGEPLFWRQFEILGSSSFFDLHKAIHFCYEWEAPASHRFYYDLSIVSQLVRIEDERALDEVFSEPGGLVNYYYFHQPKFSNFYLILLTLEEVKDINPEDAYPSSFEGPGVSPSEKWLHNAEYYTQLTYQ